MKKKLLMAVFLIITNTQNAYTLDELIKTTSNPSRDHEVEHLDLEELVAFAKRNNKSFLAAQQNPKIFKGELITAGLLPNPTLSYSYTFMGGRANSQAGSPESAPAIGMEVDIFNKRGKKVDLATKQIEGEEIELKELERVFSLHIRQTYRELLFLTSQIKSQKEFLSTYLELVNASKVRAQTGDLSGVEFDRLDLERMSFQADYLSLELRLEEISQKMRQILGIPYVGKVLTLKGDFSFIPLNQLGITQPSFTIEKRFDLALMQSKLDQSLATLTLKQTERFPSFQLTSEYRKKGPENHLGLFISIPFPVFNRNQGEIVKAKETITKLQFEIDGKKAQVSSQIQLMYNEVQSRERMLKNYQDLQLLDRNLSVAQRSRFAYLKKAYSLVALLESQRNYISVNWKYYEQLFLYYLSFDQLKSSLEGTI